MSTEDWWVYTDRVKTELFRLSGVVPVPLRPPRISTQTGLGLNPGLRDEKLAANCLSYDVTHNVDMNKEMMT